MIRGMSEEDITSMMLNAQEVGLLKGQLQAAHERMAQQGERIVQMQNKLDAQRERAAAAEAERDYTVAALKQIGDLKV